jgi:hypothetical protein
VSVVLKFDTTPSLYEPVEVEIDGRRLQVKRITLGDLERIQALQADATAGSAKAIRESLETLLVGEAADVALVAKMPLEKLAELITTVVERAVKPGPEGKNSSGPADQSSH